MGDGARNEVGAACSIHNARYAVSLMEIDGLNGYLDLLHFLLFCRRSGPVSGLTEIRAKQADKQ